jgi:carbamate kinase
LTAVEHVYINFNKPNQQKLENMSVKELEVLLAGDSFAKGSMFPKVQACVNFIKGKKNKIAIISSLEKATDAFSLKTGTIIKS